MTLRRIAFSCVLIAGVIVLGLIAYKNTVGTIGTLSSSRFMIVGDAALYAFEKTGRFQEFAELQHEANEQPHYALPPLQDEYNAPFRIWGSCENGEPLVIATPGKNGYWEWTQPGPPEEDAVREHYLQLAAALTRSLIECALLPSGDVVHIPNLQRLSFHRSNDDLIFFVDVSLVASLIEGATHESTPEDTLYRVRLETLRERLKTLPQDGVAWSPLSSAVLQTGGITQQLVE